MTAYQGGKKRIGKEVADFLKEIEKELRNEKLDYLEPFCGMCGVAVHMVEPGRIVTCNDINTDVIMMWRAVQRGWMPDYCPSREDYEVLKTSRPSKERGFYGVVCSYGATFFKGYREGDHYVRAGMNNLKAFKPKMKSVRFKNMGYESLTPTNKLIYCDPPYENSNLYSKHFTNFDSDEFWEIMREWSVDNIVVVSERVAPDDFVCIWKKSVLTPLADKRYYERLFVHESLL